ncbi:DUF4164 domain-containing protein [Jiella sp. MQZ9-1]|uniref:DUF4164 domain-containing protein n=1 Tax=Jiella flava TaxID=2816857 RepID=A0A939FU97_9HYPH|nr:DUF4164 domain-containing protein [Jiella flava]MBO0662063.1 DUF4164 domain-containing protein [Jiella flava]MCD2470609.1 DUF4164 domain-containing protein [Jiella flava]
MPHDDPFDVAKVRLRTALERLENVVEVRLERENDLKSIDAEVQRQTADRGRLARELDAALARGERLEQANREVSKRLVDAMEQVRKVLDQHK